MPALPVSERATLAPFVLLCESDRGRLKRMRSGAAVPPENTKAIASSTVQSSGTSSAAGTISR